ncbi:unnamed protein product [Aphanomyces euteiches]|uniref:DDHD domain-containing protein n=1 Tax=Aphanomyces euteiches TaxID=100861 RepID=A0A6G0WJ01_9STRA|nr:hypothetical protein Ae201684_014732 [Aphanomyces euteiches]KAH9078413.1 hypothetical protein Ae201684P_019501 [Aphanomyces euteiches]
MSGNEDTVPWAYMRKGEWIIFSKEDCEKLEASRDEKPVVVDHGRLEVSVRERSVSAVFWKEGPCPVVRSEWLFENTSGKIFPLSEDESTEIKRLWSTLPKNEPHNFALPVVDHRSGLEIKFGPAKTALGQRISELFLKCSHTRTYRCKAIHHGYNQWTSSTSREVNHLVFVVHGIGETYCKKRTANGTIIDYSYSMRQDVPSILTSHFPQSTTGIEFLPVDWSDVLLEMGDNLHSLLSHISFDTMPFVRQICNELLSDILMYMERQQRVLEYVANYMNTVYALYLHRHPGFQGKVSIMGHSLGSVITYDLLSKQADEDWKSIHLDFNIHTFFGFGAPVGLFLALRGKGESLALPTCKHLYNINHPADPISYRLEPLLVPQATVQPPVRLNTYSGWKRIHHAVQDIVESIDASQKKLTKDIGNALGKMLKPSSADAAASDASATLDGASSGEDADAKLQQRLEQLNPLTKRLDYVLPESEIEALTPIAALTAHTGYWTSMDFLLFIVSQLVESS